MPRILFWNIKQGGGKRATGIVRQILKWDADVVALCEFRDTPPSQSIARDLFQADFIHQLTTAESAHRTRNSLLLASRFELTQVSLESAPKPDHLWLLAQVYTEPIFHIGVMHIPYSFAKGRIDYYQAARDFAKSWKRGAAMLIGDTNSALNSFDEETYYSDNYKDIFMNPVENAGWRDIFRAFHKDTPAPTWYSPAKVGFRLDQSFVNTELQEHVTACEYEWGQAGDNAQLSDHAAILLDIEATA